MLLMSQTKRAVGEQGNISKGGVHDRITTDDRASVVGLSSWEKSNSTTQGSACRLRKTHKIKSFGLRQSVVTSYLNWLMHLQQGFLFSHPPSLKACQANPHIAWAMSMIVACCIDCQIVIMGSW